MNIPDDLSYSKDHEWARFEPDGRVRVGITDFAQEQLGDIVYVQLPSAGQAVKAGEAMGEIESPKAVSDLYSPLTGACIEVNPAIAENPELLNQDPYGDGWLALIDPSQSNELELMDAHVYRAFLESSA